MSEEITRIASIHEMHQKFGFPKPKHPLISLVDSSKITIPRHKIGSKSVSNLYMISIKDKNCGLEYGRNALDFSEGVLVFSAPGQVYTVTREVQPGDIEGWMLYFHPDLIRNSPLADSIDGYSFFNYDVYEALHLSDEEKQTVEVCLSQIKNEYEQRIDKHSQKVIISNIELLLHYSLRFYERQFHTRTNLSRNVAADFEKELKAYYRENKALEFGVPAIGNFAANANLSQHYFSDLIKKETGRSPKDHINDYIVERAKNLLVGSRQSVSEIAYDLGFNYPHYFTRLFKSKTGKTPVQYRKMN